MIGRLTGHVVHDGIDGIVLDVGGVGYDVVVPLGTLGRARPDADGRVTLMVHTHVREDALALYGFSDETERAAFRALLGVSNVGPRIAIAVLSALPAADLSRAIARQDLSALKGVSGVGKKIAERLLLELRDKLPAVILSGAYDAASPPGATPRPPTTAPSTPDDRIRATLVGMGFKPSEADRAVTSLGPRASTEPLETVLREALALLAK